MQRLLEALREFDALRDQPEGDESDRVAVRDIPNCAPTYDELDVLSLVNPAIRAALTTRGMDQVYEHQAEAIRKAVAGEDVVLEAPTASGKTLAFLVPMFDILLKDHKSHAMMIHPMKALSNDQRRQINELIDWVSAASRGRRIESWTYDGDTDQEHRADLRGHPPAIMLTNPEMLQFPFLGHSNLWEGFLKGVRFIVIDEIHEYRGYFGTNFALLLRRFLMKLAKLGNRPQLFLATATCANPLEHARNLTGRDVHLVTARNKFQPNRLFAFVSPRIRDFRYQEIYKLRIARAALACLSMDLSTLVFCPSRKFAEDICRRAKRDATDFQLDPDTIISYRSGYTADQRRNIEEGMRTGAFKVVFSTNALELGIDIGRLDACILAGFPDNTMSAWQRIGRIGRSWDKTARILYYAMNNAYDGFYADNIDAFLHKPLDEIFISTSNEELIDRHIQYALHECDWVLTEEDKNILGGQFWQRAKQKSLDVKPIHAGPGPNYRWLDIRGGSGGVFKLVCKGNQIGTMSDVQRFREAYIGAMYNHCGRVYRVVGHGADDIQLEDAEPHLRTEGGFYTVVQTSDILDAARHNGAFAIYYGKITVFENFTGYKLMDERSDQVLEEKSAQSARTHNAMAFWLSIDDRSSFDLEVLDTGIRTVEQFLRIGSVFVIPSDRHDVSTYSNPQIPSVYMYENVSGGIGIAEKIYAKWQEVLRAGVDIGQKCPCKDGCPRCIHAPRLKDPKSISKLAGFEVAQRFMTLGKTAPTEVFDPVTHGWRPADSVNAPSS